MTRRRVVIIGAGAAGSAAATVLGSTSAELEVVIVGQEDRPPYNRTTVNKGLLSGAVQDCDISLPGLDGTGAVWRLGEQAVDLDPVTKQVRLVSGELLSADALVLATGASPRGLGAPVAEPAAARLVSLRTAADTARLRETLSSGTPALVAGAGLIGTELAGVLRTAGHPVTLVDTAALPMKGLLGSTVAGWVADAHRTAGLDLRTTVAVTDIAADDERTPVTVTLSDGTHVEVGVVIACLGVRPATGWLARTGLPSPAGAIAVDRWQRVVGWPGIYAAGDLAAVPDINGEPATVEHWGAALSQGRVAACTVLADFDGGAAQPPAMPEPPSYSTYVHDTKLTILGWPHRATTEIPLLGQPGDDRFAVALADDRQRLVAAVGVGGARAVNRIQHLVANAAPVEALDHAGAGR